MSNEAHEKSADKSAAQEAVADSQRQRWIKYGSNVVLTVIIVVLLAAGVIYLSGLKHKRIDFTTARVYGLKPQTQSIIDHLNQKIEIYSLYPKPAAKEFDYFTPMADLLDEYHRSSDNIQVDQFDPDKEPGKLQDLIARVSKRYSGEVDTYKNALSDFEKQREALTKFGDDEGKALDKLVETSSPENLPDEQLVDAIKTAYRLVHGLEGSLTTTQDSIDSRLKGELPDYKLAASDAETALDSISTLFKQVVDEFTKYKDKADVPAPWNAYISNALERYVAAQKQNDDALAQLKKRGDIKLDALVQGIRRQAVLVIGRDDVQVIPFARIWQGNSDRFVPGQQDSKLRFAGEQQITAAIAQLQRTKKPKVCFIRAGGPPVADAEYSDNPPFSLLADRLRDYGYEISEKDATGMWTQMAQMRGQPASPEPEMKDIADAVWICVDQPQQSNGFMPPGSFADKLAEHLMNGGSALVLVGFKGEALTVALKEWGVEIHPDDMMLHERIEPKENNSNWTETIPMIQPFFEDHAFGEGQITKPLTGLEGLIMLPVPITITQTSGFHATPILPIPHDIPAWVARNPDVNTLFQEAVKPDFTKGDEMIDDSNPAYTGAVVEKDDDGSGHPGGRLVVIGALNMAGNEVMGLVDLDLWNSTGERVIKYPANSELMNNAIYWLSRNDEMIAISPAAMEIPRIKPIGSAMLSFLRIGVLIIGLPLLVVASGLTVYMNRRD